jgi:cytoskeletal protein RodZ
MTEQSPTVGALLRSAREERGMAVAEVAERTRIRSTLIREIEVDDFGGCGGRVYARGHVRAIAAVVGLDPAPVLAEFDRAYADPSALSTMTAPQPLPTLPTPSTKARAREMARAQRSGPNWVSAMIAVAVLITLLVVASSVLALVQGRHRPQPQAGAAPPPPRR